MNFDAVTPFYDVLARLIFGRRLQRAQTVFLDRVPAGASMLIVGGGTGQLLERVLVHCHPDRVLYLETSANMLARSSRRIVQNGTLGTVEFRLGDETTLRPDERFDVLMTPFVLDLFTEHTLRTTFIPRLLRTLKPGGQWLVTDFVPTNSLWQRALLTTMIRFFRLTAGIETRRLADWQQLLARAGLTRQVQQSAVGGMVSAEVWV